jgi:hypothetical protein
MERDWQDIAVKEPNGREECPRNDICARLHVRAAYPDVVTTSPTAVISR